MPGRADVYASVRNRPAISETGAVRGRVPRIVVLLGMTSLLTDISSEMVTAVLPLFLTMQLGLSPMAFGFVDGLHNGVSAVSRLGAGVLSDRLGRPKFVASMGYGLSALTRPLLIAASSVTAVASLVAVDRIGKGIRTAPRDAMIAQASRPGELGRNFGVHRAMDNAGAMLGPLLAFGVLMLLPGRFDAVFVVSAAAAMLGLAVLLLLVTGPRRSADAGPRLSRTDVALLFRSGPFLRRVGLAAVLTAFTVSDAFIFLTLLEGNRDLGRVFPLFAVGLALTYAVLAIPMGRLADRVGRMRLFVLGHVAMLAVYLVVGVSASWVGVIAALSLMGLFYAATDGVLSASVSAVLPEVSKASGLALAQTIVAAAAFAASVGFGLMVGWLGWDTAYLVMGAGLAGAVLLGAVGLMRRSPA